MSLDPCVDSCSSAVGGSVESYLEEQSDWSDIEDDLRTVSYRSPQGSKSWLPICPADQKPYVGMTFPSIDAAFSFYQNYSKVCMFDVRRGSDKKTSDGNIIRKYLLCNKEGRNSVISSLDSVSGGIYKRVRSVPSIMCGCNARITLKRIGSDGFIISHFVEAHNHKMATDIGAQFLKNRRRVNFVHQKVVVDLSKINIGPVVAFKIYKGLSGGYSNVSGNSSDFKNVQRDITSYIGEFDAQMIIEKFQNKKEVCPSFFIEFVVEDKTLTRIFWADPISIQNYNTFGDVISFDATYSLNKYKMIFVPFTGEENHKRSVTFAAALISSEDTDSYSWVLLSFLKCMGRQPSMLLTDQDASLRKVIPLVMPDAHHRFCMWHIMKKMSAKVGFLTPASQEFCRQLSTIIYSNELEIEEFETAWISLIEKYDFAGNVWLSNLFKLRKYWIPAYFRHIPLGCLLMTTSRSESQNSFFGRYLSLRMNLLAFMSGFESTIENQRYTQSLDDHDTLIKKPKTITPLAIESDACDIYTNRIFCDIQKEILSSCFEISVVNLKEADNVKIFELKDSKYTRRNFLVSHYLVNNDFQCSCKHFMRVGYQCRHIFYVMRAGSIDKIPRKYVLNRWTKNAVRMSCGDPISHTSAAPPISIIWSEFQACLCLVVDDSEKLENLTCRIKEMRIKLESEAPRVDIVDKRSAISRLIGASVPTELTIRSPVVVHTKGSGKRIISERDLAIEKSKRVLRVCGICKKKGIHDKRTCPLKGISLPVVDRSEEELCESNILI